MNCIFCSPTLNTEISQSKKTVSLCKTPLSYITPMHTLPLFCPTPCMPSPYSIPPMHALPLFYPTHACPPPILSHFMHTLPPILSQAMHTLPPILSQHMHTFPLVYPTPCIPSPYSMTGHAHLPPILSQPIHTLPLFYATPYMPSPYSIPLYACPLLFSTSPHMPTQYSIPAHASPPNSLSHEPGRHVSPLTSENATFESAHTEYIIIIYIA